MNAWLKRCVFNLDLNMDDVLYFQGMFVAARFQL